MSIVLYNSTNLAPFFPQQFQQWKTQTDIGISNTFNVQKEQYKTYIERWRKWYESLIKEEDFKQQISFLEFIRALQLGFSDSEIESLAQKEPDPEDIVYLVGSITFRLKTIIRELKSRRNFLKNTFIRQNLSRNKIGLEIVLRELLLRKYTNQTFEPVQSPLLPFYKQLPEFINAIKTINVKIEELYTTVTKGEPLLGDILLDPVDLYEKGNNILANSIGSDALYVEVFPYKEEDFNKSFSLKFNVGNNWFYFPEGKVFDKINSLSEPRWGPIPLQKSQLIESGATAGVTWEDADRIFFQTGTGMIGGAWLKKDAPIYETKLVTVTLPAKQTREFCFPYPGFQLDKNSPTILNLTHSDRNLYQYLTEIASNELHQKLVKDYWKTPLPPTASEPIFLNSTTLRDIGTPGPTSFEADLIEIRDHPETAELSSSNLYYGNEISVKRNEIAYLYEFTQTDLFIQKGDNFLVWPVYSKGAEDQPYKHQAWTSKDCAPVQLAALNGDKILGSVAGLAEYSLNQSDCIFKLSKYEGSEEDATDAAWLASAAVSELICRDTIPVYDEKDPPKPQFCQQYIEGPIQSTLAFKCQPLEKVSFVWCGPDTYADEVFFFHEHSDDCPYKNFRIQTKQTDPPSLSLYFSVADYYNNQNFLNPSVQTSLEKLIRWESCTCKSVHFSPIGHIGEKYDEYNGICDLLFVDPQGYGEHFIENSWRDTRGYSVKDSPQFAFFQLKKDNNADTPIGFGPGQWKTSAGTRMVLKTGFRYTYVRTSLRTDYEIDKTLPSFYVRYVYPKVEVRCDLGCYDLVFVLDLSRSVKRDLAVIQRITTKIIDYVLNEKENKTDDIQVGLVAFDFNGVIASYLSKDRQALKNAVYSLFPAPGFPKYLTNLKSGLSMARHILFDTITTGPIGEGIKRFNDLCNNLLNFIQSSRKSLSINKPNNCGKKIVLISDGVDTIENYINLLFFHDKNNINDKETALEIAQDLKQNKNTDIIAVEIGPKPNGESSKSIMNKIASNGKWIDAESLLFEQGVNEDILVQKILGLLNGNCPVQTPTWCKMYKNPNGEWVKTLEPSDMVLQPGDCLLYKHAAEALYLTPENNLTFQTPSIDFTINVRLGGWHYLKKEFNEKLYRPGNSFIGARPFWGKVSTEEGGVEFFKKSCYGLGGFVRWVGDLAPLKQPPICQAQIINGSHLLYTNKSTSTIIWQQPTPLIYQDPSKVWCDLEITVQNFSTTDIANPLNFGIKPTTKISQIQLQDVLFNDVIKWNYFAKKPFTWNFKAQQLYHTQKSIKQINYIPIKATQPWDHGYTLIYPSFPFRNINSIPLDQIWTSRERNQPLLRPDIVGLPQYSTLGFKTQITQDRLNYFYHKNNTTKYVLSNVNNFLIPYQHRWLFINDSRNTPVEITSFYPFYFINYDNNNPNRGMLIGTDLHQTFSGNSIIENEFAKLLPNLPNFYTCTHYIQKSDGVVLSLYKNLSGEKLFYKQHQISGPVFVSYGFNSSALPLSSALPSLYSKHSWPLDQLFTHIEQNNNNIKFYTDQAIYNEILVFDNNRLIVSDHTSAVLSFDNQTSQISFTNLKLTEDLFIEWAAKVQVIPPFNLLITLFELVNNQQYILRDQITVTLPSKIIDYGIIQNCHLKGSSLSINQITKEFFISILFVLEYSTSEKYQFQSITKYDPQTVSSVITKI